MHLLIDNYDSFTYNIVHRLGELGAEVAVARNDRITLDEAKAMAPQSLIVSPGPDTPDGAGVSLEFIEHFMGRIPVLGICLGHQCIVQACGGVIHRADRVMHGKTSQIYHDGRTIYVGLPAPFPATRYHSLIACRETLPDCLEVTARSGRDEIMGVRLPGEWVEGVQFHPESILTVDGHRLMDGFLEMTRTGETRGRG